MHVHEPTRVEKTRSLRETSLPSIDEEHAYKDTRVGNISSLRESSSPNSAKDPVNEFERIVAAELEALCGRILIVYKNQLSSLLKECVASQTARPVFLNVEGSTEVARQSAHTSVHMMQCSSDDERNVTAIGGSPGSPAPVAGTRSFSGSIASRGSAQLVVGAHSMFGEIKALRKTVMGNHSYDSTPSESAGVVRRAINRPSFSNFVTFTIFINALTISIQTEWRAHNVGSPEPTIFEVVDMCCNAIFLIELGLKLVVYRGSYFIGKAWKWNLFDFLVVMFALVEVLAMILKNSVSIPGATLLRVLRLMRIVRTVRALRVASIFRELRMMVHSIMNCVMAFSWLLLLLAFVMFVCSVFITHGVTDQKEHLYNQGLQYDDDTRWLDEHFGSLAKSFYSMFKVISDGQGWGIYCDHLLRTSSLAAIVLMAYIAFTTFAVLNIVTGIFVNFSMKAAEDDSDTMALEYAEKQEKLIRGFCTAFSSADSTGTGFLTFDDFVLHVGDPRVRAYLKFIDLDIELFTPEKIFKLLDFDGDGQIDLKEFVTGLSKFRGNARALDMAALHCDIMKVNKRVDVLMRKTKTGSSLSRSSDNAK